MCQHLPVPSLHQILHMMMVMCCIALENMTLCSIISGCLWWRANLVCPERMSSNIIHWLLFQLAWDVQAQIHFGWRAWCAWVPEHADCCAVSFLGDSGVCHSLFCCFSGGVSSDCIHYSLTFKVQWRNALHQFSSAADGRWWGEHARPFGHCWACVELTLHILNVSISCWWGYSKHLLERFQLL
jgi:hypothetical protein